MFYLIELILLAISLSLDTLVAGISMGIERIKVPTLSILILNFVSTLFLFLSCWLGSRICYFLPNSFTNFFSAFLFLILGIGKILESICKRLPPREFSFHLLNINIIFKIYQKPSKADLDHSKTLSIKELILLGTALSVDNLVIGLGMGVWLDQLLFIIVMHFLFGSIFFTIFNRLAFKITFYNHIDSSIISGFLFIFVGICQFFS